MELEYTGYTADKIKKDIRKNTASIVAVIFPLLLGAILMIGSIVSILSDVSVVNAKETSYKDIKSTSSYYFDEMILVDMFAFFGDKQYQHGFDSDYKLADYQYYLVLFEDKDGKLVYTSISTKDSSELREKCEAYIEDDSLVLGDVILSGCFSGYENSGSTVTEHMKDAYDVYNAEIPGELLEWTFKYDGETADEVAEKKSSEVLPMALIGVAFAAGGAIGLVVLLRKRKEIKEYLPKEVSD